MPSYGWFKVAIKVCDRQIESEGYIFTSVAVLSLAHVEVLHSSGTISSELVSAGR